MRGCTDATPYIALYDHPNGRQREAERSRDRVALPITRGPRGDFREGVRAATMSAEWTQWNSQIASTAMETISAIRKECTSHEEKPMTIQMTETEATLALIRHFDEVALNAHDLDATMADMTDDTVFECRRTGRSERALGGAGSRARGV